MERDDDEAAGAHRGAGPGQFGGAEFGAQLDDIDDPELAAAIEASYRAQTNTGMADSEDQMMAQALELSRLEEEARQRAGEAEMAGLTSGGSPAVSPPSAMAPGTGQGSSSSSGAALAAAALGGLPDRAGFPGSGSGPAPFPRGTDMEDDFSDHAGSPRVVDGIAPQAGDEEADAHLAAAIEASYASQTEGGMMVNEEDLIQQALRISQQEEEQRQRASLREQQEAELQESILMDQMREQEDKKRRVEEEQLRALEAERLAEEEKKKSEEQARKSVEQAAKRGRVPPEPPAGEPGRVDLQIRTPDGRRTRRAFRGTDLIGQVYDYIDVEGLLGDAMADKAYRLVSTMPRKEYKEREQSLAEAGLQGQTALLVEPCAEA